MIGKLTKSTMILVSALVLLLPAVLVPRVEAAKSAAHSPKSAQATVTGKFTNAAAGLTGPGPLPAHLQSRVCMSRIIDWSRTGH